LGAKFFAPKYSSAASSKLSSRTGNITAHNAGIVVVHAVNVKFGFPSLSCRSDKRSH
jgi:hypothetical protein